MSSISRDLPRPLLQHSSSLDQQSNRTTSKNKTLVLQNFQREGNQNLPHQVACTTSKKRKFNQISNSAVQQFESLNLNSKFGQAASINSSKNHKGLDDPQMSKRRRINGDEMGESIQQMITLQRNESKDKRPFQTIYCINNLSGVINQQVVKTFDIKKPQQQRAMVATAEQNISKSKFEQVKEVNQGQSTTYATDFKLDSLHQTRIPASETKDNLKSRLSRHRLSQITEKSADDHLTVNNNQSAPRRLSGGYSRRSSSQGCDPHARDNSEQRVSSVLVNVSNRSSCAFEIANSSSKLRSSISVVGGANATQRKQSFVQEHLSDMAQLGTPNQLEYQMEEEIPPFCSQSAISIADDFSEISQFDFSFNNMTGPNPSTSKRHSSFDPTQNATAATIGSGFNLPFNLSPLNEFDDQFEDPLNKAMIMDQSCTSSMNSKVKHHNNEQTLLQGDETCDVGGGDPKNFSLAALLLPHMGPEDINLSYDCFASTSQMFNSKASVQGQPSQPNHPSPL